MHKLCNFLFSDVLAKRPALDALLLWTLELLWPVSERPESGRYRCSGRVGGVQSRDAVLKIARGKIIFFANLHSDSFYKIGGNITSVSSYD